MICHFTSRAGDPHRHLHLQINARVFAEGTWRGLHTVGVRDSLDEHASLVAPDRHGPEFFKLGRRLFTTVGDVRRWIRHQRLASAPAARLRKVD